ncbi:hypothetical protein ACFQVA_02125 [Actinomadura keratinilytica]
MLLGTYAIDLAAMFFAFPNTIFPFLADELDADWSLGLMYAAGSVGSLLVSLTSGWASRTRRHGLLVVFGATGWGLAIAAAGWMSDVWLVLVCLALAGAGDMLSGLGRSTIWNQTIPDELRGGWPGSRSSPTVSAPSSARCGPVRWPAGPAPARPSGPAASPASSRWACSPPPCPSSSRTTRAPTRTPGAAARRTPRRPRRGGAGRHLRRAPGAAPGPPNHPSATPGSSWCAGFGPET